MKKLILGIPLSLMLFFSTNLSAQLAVGGGLTITTDSGFDRAGVAVRGVYSFNDNWRAGASFNFPFPESYSNSFFGEEVKVRYFDFSADANYVFAFKDDFSFYGLAGINYFSVSVKSNGGKSSASSTGLELGGGAEWAFSDNLKAFGETKYVIGDADRFILSVGVLYSF